VRETQLKRCRSFLTKAKCEENTLRGGREGEGMREWSGYETKKKESSAPIV
jgi:hypothetical protein